MGARDFISSMGRMLHVASKPGREEVTLLLKVCLLGVAIVGGLGFVVKVLFWKLVLVP